MSAVPLLEIIVVSLDDAIAAAAGGAQRFELCSAMALGGLTPSIGLLRAIKEQTQVPVMSMLRPREGGMAYTRRDFETLLVDAELLLDAGTDGLVFGFLTADGRVDTARLQAIMRLVQRRGRPIQTVFHRAFDVVADPRMALEQLIDHGVSRILTSGRRPTALQGAAEIRRTIEQADGRIEVLPGGAIDLQNLNDVVNETGADQVHLYLSEIKRDNSPAGNPAIYFGAHLPAGELEYRSVTEELVRSARGLLTSRV